MEDKIGLSLGANRIGITYYKDNQFEKSLEYHLVNIQLSDSENIFAGYYNAGITYWKLRNHLESLQYFEKALEWTKQKEVRSKASFFRKLSQNVWSMVNSD